MAKIKQQKTAYVVSLSGGKDSVTMLIKMLESGNYPVTHIFAVDTGVEFTENLKFLKRLDKYLRQKYNKHIIFLNPKMTYEETLFFKGKKGKNAGITKGFDRQYNSLCFVWRVNKRDVINRLKKDLRAQGYNRFVFYVGYAYDEKERADAFIKQMEGKFTKFKAPLITDFKMTEEDCLNFIKSNPALYNPLYNHFNRTGCKFCHKQKMESWYKLYQYYYNEWDQFKNYEWKVQKTAEVSVVKNPFPFLNNKGTTDVEKEEFYKREEKEVVEKLTDFIEKESKKEPYFEIFKEAAHTLYWMQRHRQIADDYYTDKKAEEKVELMKKVMKDEIPLTEAEEKLALEFRNEREFTFRQELLKILKEESGEIEEFLDSLNKTA